MDGSTAVRTGRMARTSLLPSDLRVCQGDPFNPPACMEGVALPIQISVGRNPLVWVVFPVASWIEDQVTSRSLRWVGT